MIFNFKESGDQINPKFPNWQKSFVSGPDSPLFLVEHRISKDNSQKLISEVSFKAAAEGPPKHVHGGATAGLIDELMGILVWHNQFLCVTQNLNLNYLKAIPLGDAVFAQTIITKNNERTVEVETHIYSISDMIHQKTPYVKSQGVFYKLSLEQLKRFQTIA